MKQEREFTVGHGSLGPYIGQMRSTASHHVILAAENIVSINGAVRLAPLIDGQA